MSALTGTASSAGRWLRADDPPMPYAAVSIQQAASMAEASSTPPNVPEEGSSAEASYTTANVPDEASTAAPGIPSDEVRTRKNVIFEPGRPIVRIRGEPFFVEHEGEIYYIVHDRWSLMGSGDTLAEAYKHLLQMAAVLAPVYGRTPPNRLDAEGTRLTRFLLHSR